MFEDVELVCLLILRRSILFSFSAFVFCFKWKHQNLYHRRDELIFGLY